MKKIVSLILAAAMVFSLAACGTSKDEKEEQGMDKPSIPHYKTALAVPEYPSWPKCPNYDDYEKNGSFDDEAYNADYEKWTNFRMENDGLAAECRGKLDAYLEKATPVFLSGANGENLVCSPVNIYMALSLLAECTGGDSRQQILDLLDVKDLDELRTITKALWQSNYCDDGVVTEILGTSAWLNEDFEFKKETVAALAEHYYASVYCGGMTGGDFFEDFKTWLNEQTKGLLKDQVDTLEPFKPDDVLILATTIYFKGSWINEFLKDATDDQIFHGAEDRNIPFMHQNDDMMVYFGEDFKALRLYFNNGPSMWIMLPDEGVSPDTLFASGEAMNFLLDENKEGSMYKVELSLPKFDVNSTKELTGSLTELGVEDVFSDVSADFSPLTDTDGLYVSSVTHSARVKIDEEGCEAAAFTVIVDEACALIESEVMEFNVDRPFAFAIAGSDGMPLFTGIVNEPIE